ncbi:hypothetical protein BJ742DRAFT_785399 [Cladochytrium replicatum]|nr:hypothetical protein BJ742DRAFT_785399 [Cladochytrium replicatum]
MAAYRAVALGFREKDREGVCDLFGLGADELEWVAPPEDTAFNVLRNALIPRPLNHSLIVVSQYENGGRIELIGRMKHLWWIQRIPHLKANHSLVIVLRGNFSNELRTSELRETVENSALQEFAKINGGVVRKDNFKVIVKGTFDMFSDEEKEAVKKWVPAGVSQRISHTSRNNSLENSDGDGKALPAVPDSHDVSPAIQAVPVISIEQQSTTAKPPVHSQSESAAEQCVTTDEPLLTGDSSNMVSAKTSGSGDRTGSAKLWDFIRKKFKREKAGSPQSGSA